LAEKSVQALKKAIQLEPSNHKHWNALGYVACLKGMVVVFLAAKLQNFACLTQ
jgi:hypothetical protein